jgi:hypothetical protein
MLFGALAAGAAAKPRTHSALLVQSAMAATLSPAHAHGTRTLLLTDADPRLLAVADRPSRASGELTPALYRKLWRTTFHHDAPNAALVGTNAAGARVRVPLVLRTQRTIAGGDMRYTVRPLARTGSLSLTGVTLLIDNAGVVFDEYEAAINAVNFPQNAVIDVAADATIPPGITMTVPCNPTTLQYRTLTLGAGASLVLVSAVEVTINFVTALPSGGSPSAPLTASATGALSSSLQVPAPGEAAWMLWTSPAATFTLTAAQTTVLEDVTLRCG